MLSTVHWASQPLLGTMGICKWIRLSKCMLTVPSCSWHLEGEKQFSKQMTNAILKRKGCNRCGGKAHLLLSVMVGSFCKHLCWVVDDRAEPALQRFVGKLFQEEASSSTNALTHLWNHYKEPVWIASTYKTAVVCLSGDMTWTNTPFTKVSEDEEKEFDEKVFPDTTLSEAHRRCLSAGVLKASVAHFSLCCMWVLPPLWFFIMDHYSVPKQTTSPLTTREVWNILVCWHINYSVKRENLSKIDI